MERVFFVTVCGKLNSILRYFVNIDMMPNWTNKKTATTKKLKLKGASRDISFKVNKPSSRNSIATRNGKVEINVNKFCPLVIVNLFI